MARTVIRSRSGQVSVRQFDRFANDPAGPIRTDLRRRAGNVQQYQIRHAPRRTGRLVSTSRKREGRIGGQLYVEVLVGRAGMTDYLGYVLFGTQAHEIRAVPNRPNAHLRFIAGGRIVYARRVWHPGSQANNFVRDSLVAGAR